MLNYSQVEWLQNSTSNTSSYIELNYYPSSATKIEVDAAFFTGGSGYSGIFGIFTNNTTRAFWANVNSNWLCWTLGNSNYSQYLCYDYTNYRDGVRRTYAFENGAVYVNGVQRATCTKQTISGWGYKLNWFAGSADWTGGMPQRVYGIKVYNIVGSDQILKLNLIPAIRWRDRAIGLLDTISDEFYVAPAGFTSGKPLTDYTDNLQLRINYQDTELVKYYISEDSKNFKLIDSGHPAIKNKDITLTAMISNIDQKFKIDASEKDAIWRLINNKLDIVDNMNTVSNTLISKLETDYTKTHLTDKIASKDDLKNEIASECAIIMMDIYNKAEVDSLVSKGGGSSMENYYTKTEIDELIPEKEDLSKIHEFLESMTDYYLALDLFTKLNGKGD